MHSRAVRARRRGRFMVSFTVVGVDGGFSGALTATLMESRHACLFRSYRRRRKRYKNAPRRPPRNSSLQLLAQPAELALVLRAVDLVTLADEAVDRAEEGLHLILLLLERTERLSESVLDDLGLRE